MTDVTGLIVHGIYDIKWQCYLGTDITYAIKHFRLFSTKNQIPLSYILCFLIPLYYPPNTSQSLSKKSAMDRFALAWVRTNLNCLPNTLLICAMGTLSPSVVQRGSDWAGPDQLVEPLVLTNQVVFTKYSSQCLKIPPLLSMCFLIIHCTFPLFQCLVNMTHPVSTVLSGPDIYGSIFEISPIVWLWGFLGDGFAFQGPGWC